MLKFKKLLLFFLFLNLSISNTYSLDWSNLAKIGTHIKGNWESYAMLSTVVYTVLAKKNKSKIPGTVALVASFSLLVNTYNSYLERNKRNKEELEKKEIINNIINSLKQKSLNHKSPTLIYFNKKDSEDLFRSIKKIR